MEIQSRVSSHLKNHATQVLVAPTIYSETVCLRQLAERDTSSILHSNCHDDLIKTISWESECASDIFQELSASETCMTWASEDVVTGNIFGTITLIEISPIAAEIEFTFHCERWKRHLSFESLRLILDWGFERFPQYSRIQARVLLVRGTSGSLLTSVGMRSEGVSRSAAQVDDSVVDLSCHAMTREDWKLRHGSKWGFVDYDVAHI